MNEVIAALIYKLVGAVAGAILALVFVPPRTKAGFFRRLSAALIFGVVFAAHVRSWAAFADDYEGLISAACLTGFVSWWLMGAIKRAAEAWQGPKVREED